MTILIIDDKRPNIFAMEKLLEKPGRTFLTATSGPDGLKIAYANSVDLIILDVLMPEMDGFEVAQILKSNKRTKDIPIIFASGEKKERNSIMKGFEEGAVDYLFKPLDPEVTKAKVSVLLQLQMQKKELIEKNAALEKAEVQIKSLNAELKNYINQLESTNKELESFSYSISHDLRAPLRAVTGYTRMVQEDFANALGEEGMRLLNVVQNNVSKMNILIEGLLEFSRSGKKPVTKSVIDSNNMVERVIQEIKQSNGKNMNVKISDLHPVNADPILLAQVWTNLISNAFKYSSRKDNQLVEICSEKKNGYITYSVKDNGAGFSMDYADKLFNVFQRLHPANEFEGTGVGLAIVQRIIVRHGGKVWAEGTVDEGATFYFALPAN